MLGMIFALITAMLFAAGTTETKAPAGSVEPTTITYYTWDDASHRALIPFIDAFNTERTEILVDGMLTIGFVYPALLLAEQYNSPDSPYWSFKVFLGVLLRS
ncbi:MAG: DUF2264 domain-containing protein [Sphaerochaeta sp.]|nr:DUF2264 domain-containing protein [Sphaerochaeta sp.]